ncbi:MAG TPA: hypothetical protein VLZ33_02295 [Dysgonamonadaceae bacterium]|nr:hypothetical protein [Dysgonamonadaceae bacterium]
MSSNYSPSNGLLLWGYEIYLRSISCIEQSNCIYEFNYAPFPITNYWVQPRYSYTEEFFDNQNSLLTESFTDYASNNPKHTFPISQRTTNSLGETLKTEYQYPLDLPNKPQAEKLISANRISEPLVVKSYNNGNLVSQQETVYGDFIGLTLPKFVYAKKGAYPEEKKISYDWYDNKGNLMQYTLENGIPVSIIWGYNGQYPIAKIEGVAYSQISNSFIQDLKGKSNDDNDRCTGMDEDDCAEAKFRKRLNDLRINNLFVENPAMITGYTYDPLIGVTSIIQPNGQIEYYEYDDAGRLEYIKDHNGKVIKRMEYHYKN